MGKASKLAVVISTSILLTSCLGLFPEEHRASSIDRYPYPDIPAGYGRLLFHGMSNTVTSETLYCHDPLMVNLLGIRSRSGGSSFLSMYLSESTTLRVRGALTKA